MSDDQPQPINIDAMELDWYDGKWDETETHHSTYDAHIEELFAEIKRLKQVNRELEHPLITVTAPQPDKAAYISAKDFVINSANEDYGMLYCRPLNGLVKQEDHYAPHKIEDEAYVEIESATVARIMATYKACNGLRVTEDTVLMGLLAMSIGFLGDYAALLDGVALLRPLSEKSVEELIREAQLMRAHANSLRQLMPEGYEG